ncbi:MFS transporter [Xylanimonas protaetiae]|nr:MFS transporter [Xylanimonas protaetiae]
MSLQATATTPGAPPVLQGRRLLLCVVSLGIAVVPVQLDALVAATALPTIAGDLGGFASLAWIATAYLLAMAVGTLASGRLGDLFGRRALLVAALLVFGVGSLLSGVAPSMGFLIAARAAQGLGAGMTLTTLLAAVADVAPPEKRAQYQGVLGAIAPVSMLLGPWAGGLVTDHLGWRWVFLLNLPLVAVALLGVVAFLRLPVRPAGGRVDVLGLVASSVAASAIVLAVTWGGNQYPWGSPQVLTAVGVAVVAVAALVAVERRATHPVLPLGLFRDRTVVLALVVLAVAMGTVLMSATNYLPAYLELVQGHSAANSGLLLLPLLLPAIATAGVLGRWTTTPTRIRAALLGGAAVLAAACALLATMTAATPGWQTAAYQVVAGLGMGALFMTPMVLVQNAVPPAVVGAATGTAGFVRMLGAAAGTGALGSVFTHAVAQRLPAGVDAASLTPAGVAAMPEAAQHAVRAAVASGSSSLFWVTAAVALVAVLAAVALPRGRRTGR